MEEKLERFPILEQEHGLVGVDDGGGGGVEREKRYGQIKGYE